MVTREEKNKDIQNQIEYEKKYEKRKKIVKIVFKILLLIILIFFLLYFYAKYSTTYGLVVREERIYNHKIPDSFNGNKIIHFTDLDYGTSIFKNELDNLVRVINERNPDLIVFTGNLISKNYKLSTKEQEEVIKSLQNLNANIGKYAVMGKDDDKDSFNTIMNQSDFTILDNNYDLVYNNTTPILIVGLSSYVNNNRNVDQAFKYFKEQTYNSNIYTISIMSETEDLDDIILNYNPDLVLAGNSLNGEISLPFIGGIIRQSGSSKYINPYYKNNNTDIYISGGLASKTIGFRIFNNPSINFYRLTNKK